jgi:hypothetical protein
VSQVLWSHCWLLVLLSPPWKFGQIKPTNYLIIDGHVPLFLSSQINREIWTLKRINRGPYVYFSIILCSVCLPLCSLAADNWYRCSSCL